MGHIVGVAIAAFVHIQKYMPRFNGKDDDDDLGEGKEEEEADDAKQDH